MISNSTSSSPLPSTSASTSQSLPKRSIMVLTKNSDAGKFKLTPTLEQERRILKIHPPIQYASPPEKARFLKNNLNAIPKPNALPFSV